MTVVLRERTIMYLVPHLCYFECFTDKAVSNTIVHVSVCTCKVFCGALGLGAGGLWKFVALPTQPQPVGCSVFSSVNWECEGTYLGYIAWWLWEEMQSAWCLSNVSILTKLKPLFSAFGALRLSGLLLASLVKIMLTVSWGLLPLTAVGCRMQLRTKPGSRVALSPPWWQLTPVFHLSWS